MNKCIINTYKEIVRYHRRGQRSAEVPPGHGERSSVIPQR